MKRSLILFMVLGLIAGSVATAQAKDEGLIHSGTILTSYGSSIDGEPDSCETVPDCGAWLEAGCDPALAERDPAVTASIEDVSRIADGRTSWLFELESCCFSQTVMIQFWEPDCTEIRSSRRHSGDCGRTDIVDYCGFTPIRIHESARWMTVTANTRYIPWLFGQQDLYKWSLWAPPPPRFVDLELDGHLSAVGTVVTDAPSCRSGVQVVVQERNEHGWFDMGTTTTDADGAFAVKLGDRPARYRAIALPVKSPVRPCLGSISPVVLHRH